MPKVSVIIPNYNHARFLRQRLESIYGQKYRDFELIILDDCSTDDSVAVIEQIMAEHADDGIPTRFIRNETNTGSPFKQWKNGLELANGEYVWIAESDDWASTEFLQSVMSMIAADDLDLCFSQSYGINDEGVNCGIFSRGDFYDKSHIFVYDEACATMDGFCFIPNASAVVFRRSIGLSVISHSLPYRQSGDWAFWYFLMKNGHKYGYISSPLNYFRRHNMSTCLQSDKEFLNVQEAFDVMNDFRVHGIPYYPKFWIDYWLHQNYYSLKYLFKNNFGKILKKGWRFDKKTILWLADIYLSQKMENIKIKANRWMRKK